MEKQKSAKRVIRFLFELWKITPILVVSMIISQILFAVLTTAVAPLFVSRLLTDITNGNASINGSLWLIIGYAATLFIGEVVFIRITIALSYISETKMQSIVTSRILRHLTAKSLNYHSNRMSGGMVSDANKLSGSIERFWDTIMYNIVPILTTIISVCIALSFIYWQFAIVLAILSVIIITIITMAQSTVEPISRQVAEQSSKTTAYLADVVSNIAAVKAFSREADEIRQYDKHIKKWHDARIKEMKNVVIITGSFGIMMTVMNVSAFVAAILATQYHIANIGTIYLVIIYTLNIVGQLWEVSGITRSYLRTVGDAGPMISVLDEDTEIKDPIDPAVSVIHNGEIVFDNVSFTHEERDQPLFHGFSLKINSGERIGLIGKSGSGKTSLTRILLRFSEIDDGQILIDGQNICDVTQSDLHKSIAYVPQDTMLFHRTLRENIAYGKPDATDKEILWAAKQANALDFIETLPKKFDTIVGERGVKLSGGQRQRVAIARAILKDAPILVLDEATSALDSENEQLIQDALAKLMNDRTSIVVAHRLSTIAKLDRIIVLDEGRIIEQGTHNELLKSGGIYARLWSHQSGGFIKE